MTFEIKYLEVNEITGDETNKVICFIKRKDADDYITELLANNNTKETTSFWYEDITLISQFGVEVIKSNEKEYGKKTHQSNRQKLYAN